jgi:hypothetical protein
MHIDQVDRPDAGACMRDVRMLWKPLVRDF